MLKQSTFNFLEKLVQNNNRDWFNAHKGEYEEAKENVYAFTDELIREIFVFDKQVPDTLKAKDCVMRIYRDVRFSLNKDPYKSNFGIGISPKGKNFDIAGYYLHIQPGNCFVAGGAWMPHPDHLKAIRQEIDYNGADLHRILDHPAFKKTFGGLSQEEKLKTAPKGYDADHTDIDILKLKSFTVHANISDKAILAKDGLKTVAGMFATMHPFIVFLRNSIS